jgi:hypothetical protein
MDEKFKMIKILKYISFVKIESKGKTEIYNIINNNSSCILGVIKWNCGWRRYCFYPQGDTIFSVDCLEDIINFTNDLMEKRKDAK